MKTLLNYFLAVLILGGVAAPAEAQTVAPAVLPRVEYFDAAHQRLPSETGAVERTETTFRDSISGSVRTFYLPSGKLKSYTPYAHVRRRLHHGTSSQYFENGQLRLQATYVAGKCVGDFVTYYPNGTPKRRDHYTPGQPTTGECFGPDGQPVAYFPYEQMPVYSEGAGDKAAVVRAVMLHTRYPQDALRRRVSGIVKIAFVVDKNGQVQRVRPDETAKEAPIPPSLLDAYHQLQEAAMSAVRQLKSFVPGRVDGEPVAVSFTVPVTFHIQ